jgi:hypothetical protein
VGRGQGGRDGLPTLALTLISEPTGLFNPEDKQYSEFALAILHSVGQITWQYPLVVAITSNSWIKLGI